MKGQIEGVVSYPTGLINWFFFVTVILVAYSLLLHAGNRRWTGKISQQVEINSQISIALKVAPQKPENKKKPLKLNIKKSRRFQKMIDQAGSRYEVDPDLIRAVIMVESGYNPNAVSNKGARGLMQLMPRTAEAMGVKDSFNPEHNIDGGVRYLKKLLNRFDGNVELALAAYNAGSRKVRKYKGVPPYKATRLYIQKVGEYFLFYKNYKRNGLNKV